MSTKKLLKDELEVGQRVEFFRSHDKQTKLTGTIVKVHDGPEDVVDVKSDAGNGSVSRVDTVHAFDVKLLSTPTPHRASTKETQANGEEEKAQAQTEEPVAAAEEERAVPEKEARHKKKTS